MSLVRLLGISLGLALLSSWLLGCDAGPGTVANPNLSNAALGYNGPPAKTADIRSFELNFWTFLKEDNRCGRCHAVGQSPAFVDRSDVNLAYSQAVPYVDLQNPATSAIVTKIAGGHQCWLGSANASTCADNIEQMIINWGTDSNVTSARLIQLTPPAIKDPGEAKSFPDLATTPGNNGSSFATTVHPILTANCAGCHRETATPLPIAPFFANADANSAYQAAKAKMNIDTPANSRFVVRLLQESHNCWTASCSDDAASMQTAITLFADGILPTPVDANLKTSKALNMADGIVASGGSRHESNLVALWEFKSGVPSPIAFDTSGIDPAVDLILSGSVTWMEGYGLTFSGGRAQADTIASAKLHTFIQSTGEYAIEAWVVPANVTQEDANIISYSGGDSSRNFTLGQAMYNYDFYNRADDFDLLTDDTNGEPFLSSGDNGDELLQSSLQHVVANYSPIDGRSLYINGELVNVTDPSTGLVTINNIWDSVTSAFVLGGEVSGNVDRSWAGQVRMVAIHNRTLTPAQVTQNFDVGVGEKFFLLFYVGHRIGIADSYVLFEVSQFDDFSYLFSIPTFINLDPDWVPVAVDIQGLRIGINGKEAFAGQSFANLSETVGSGTYPYDPQFGQLLSPLGAIIALDKGSASDEFFLSFEKIGTQTNAYSEAAVSVANDPADPAEAVSADIGVRTFEEINATIATITGIPVTNSAVDFVYDNYIQQLPTVEAIDAFLPSHQMAIAQLALTSCSELVDTNPGYFAGFNFGATAFNAFDDASKRAQIIDPLLTAVANFVAVGSANNMTAHPPEDDLRNTLAALTPQVLDPLVSATTHESLISQLVASGGDTTTRTSQIVKAVCAAAIGSSVMLVQ